MAAPTRDDVKALLPDAGIVQSSTRVEGVTIASGLLEISSHGFADDDEVTLKLVDDATPGASPALPGGLAESTTYTVVVATVNTFRLALNGSTITSFSSEADGEFYVRPDPWPDVDTHRTKAWTAVNNACVAHGGNVEAPIVTDMAATLAAMNYVRAKAAGNPALQASYEGLKEMWDIMYAPSFLAWSKGAPVKGGTDETPTVSEGSPRYRVLGPAAMGSTDWGTTGADVV